MFKLDNDECRDNRDVNLKALAVIYQENVVQIIQELQDNKAHYGTNIKLDDDIIDIVLKKNIKQ